MTSDGFGMTTLPVVLVTLSLVEATPVPPAPVLPFAVLALVVVPLLVVDPGLPAPSVVVLTVAPVIYTSALFIVITSALTR